MRTMGRRIIALDPPRGFAAESTAAIVLYGMAIGAPALKNAVNLANITVPTVLVAGAGVAGLAAIGTAHSLGAIVRAFDARSEVAEQVESMGADFLRIEPARWEPLADVLEHGIRADDEETGTAQLLFALLMGIREPAIAAVHVQGREVRAPE